MNHMIYGDSKFAKEHIERLELHEAYVYDNVVGYTRQFKGSSIDVGLLEMLDELATRNLEVDQILTSSNTSQTFDVTITLMEGTPVEECMKIAGFQLMRKIKIEGVGMARSHETLFGIFKGLEEKGINILGHICTDLYISLFIDKEMNLDKVELALRFLEVREVHTT